MTSAPSVQKRPATPQPEATDTAAPIERARQLLAPHTASQIRIDRVCIGVLMAIGALVGALDDAAPSGLGWADGLWRAGAGALLVLCAAFAPPIGLLVSAVAAAAASAQIGLIIVGAIGAVAAILIAWKRPPWLSAGAAVGVSVAWVVFRLPHDNFLGLSTLIAVAVVAPIVVAVLYEGPLWIVRLLGWVGALVALACLAAAVAFTLVVLDARHDVSEAQDLAEEAVEHFREGDEEAAQETLDEAVVLLGEVESATSSTWMNLTRGVPGVGQHTSAIQTVARSGAETAVAAQSVLSALDRDSLTIIGGVVDLDAVAAMEPSVTALAETSAAAQAELEAVDSPWLLAPVADGMDDAIEEVTDLAVAAARADDAVKLAPAMLGGDGVRTHLVLFATPAELRGSVGLIGNYAVVEAEDGALRLTKVGRASDIVEELQADPPVLTEPAEYVERYTINQVASEFHDITISPNFPDVASVAAQLFEAATGTPVDTVMLVDPEGIAALIELTGPVTVGEHTLDPDNARDYLLISQYLLFETNEERIAFLSELLTQTFTRLLTIDFPDPWDLDEVFDSVTAEDRLVLSSMRGEEDQLLADLGMTGSFLGNWAEGDDFLGVVGQNQGQNKIDSWLERRVDYDVSLDPATGAVTATVRVELKNLVPSLDLPDAVAGNNDQDLPRGTNRMALTVYSPHALQSAMVDGEEMGFGVLSEFGLSSFTRAIDIGPGQTVVAELALRGDLAPGDPYRLVMPVQATVVADSFDIGLAVPGGYSLDGAGPRWSTRLNTSQDQEFTVSID